MAKPTVVIPKPKSFVLSANRHHSPIWGAGYDLRKKVLFVAFSAKPRKYYGYANVPEYLGASLVQAAKRNGWSALSIFSNVIKPKFNEVIQNGR